MGEKGGRVRVFANSSAAAGAVIADLAPQALLHAAPPTAFALTAQRLTAAAQVYNYWDRGMLGLAVHPAFPAVPSLFVLYVRDAFYGAERTFPAWGDGCPSPPGGAVQGCAASATLSRLDFQDLGGTRLVGTLRARCITPPSAIIHPPGVRACAGAAARGAACQRVVLSVPEPLRRRSGV